MAEKQIVVLNIADDYPFGDPELMEILSRELDEYL
jgi:predicted protein tyrosine phosphatase